MTKLIDDAVDILRNLPDDVAAAAARAIIECGMQDDEELFLSDSQAAEVERRLALPDRTMLSVKDVHARLRRFGV